MKGSDVRKKLQNRGLTMSAVANLMGETPQNLNSMLRAQDVKSGVLENIAKAINKPLTFFYTDAVELMTETEMEQHDREVAAGEWNVATDRLAATPAIDPTEGIPLIPIDAMAGFGRGEFQIMEHDCERYVVPIFKGGEFLIAVRGDSMQPKYNSGDVVACKNLPITDLFFQWGKVYVVDTAQGALIKTVQKGSDNDHILLSSENPKYDPFELHKSQINAIAIAIGVIRLE